MTQGRPFGDLLAMPLRSGVTVAASDRGAGIKMLNMGELFRYPQIPDVEMARVDLGKFDPERVLLRPGDLMFARRSLTLEGAGKCSIVKEINEPTTWESSIIRARLDNAVAHPPYYFYFFRSPLGRRLVETIVEQVAAAGIRLSELRTLTVPLPDLREQQAIAEVLGALDDKIAANARLVESADALSAATFASMLADTDSMPLTAVASFINGRAFTKNATGTGRVVIRIAELNSGIGGSTVYNDLDVPEQHLARPGDLLFAWSGSLTLHRWYRPEGIVNQHIFKVFPTAGYPMWCVRGLIARKLDEFKSIAADKATTMGHIQRRHLDEPVNVPSQSQIRSHDVFMSALCERALAAEQESLTLEATRDALLPQLMSGNIRVNDVENTVGEVL
jgi:type I restriction enzyme, S subunit